MKKLAFCVVTLLTAISICCKAEDYLYVNADTLPILGKVMFDGADRYERVPESELEGARSALIGLSKNSAGLYLRFRSDSDLIIVRWKPRFGGHMDHMTDIGVRGVDLYVLEKGGWRFLGSGRACNPDENKTVIINDMTRQEREYMLYLPLYDSVSSVEIGVNSDSYVKEALVNSPRREGPIVMYGTSILQGGCASRPGMAYTNILSRKLDREVINFGFSGNARLDLEMARAIAKVENPSIFVLDYCPNTSIEQIKERGEEFFRIIRDAHPDVPIIFLEESNYSKYGYDRAYTKSMDEENQVQAELFARLKKQGEKKIYQIKGSMIGDDYEATVDGVHFTDLGMVRYAERIAPFIKRWMKK